MGCITSKLNKKRDFAYKNELGNPLLKNLASNLPRDSKVIVIRLHSLRDLIAPSSNLSGSADPYVEFKLLPEDAIAGDQYQRSSFKPSTIAPSWIPDERFQFVISGRMEGKIIISILSFRPALSSIPMADALINLKDIDVSIKGPTKKTLKLISPETGKTCGTGIIDLECLQLDEALAYQEQTIFQYERWQPVVEWGSTMPGHFLPSDPGKWSTADGKQYSDSLEKIATIPDKWIVSKHWFTLSSEEDPDGWLYASNFGDINWHSAPNKAAALMVRRRAWRRELVLESSAAAKNVISTDTAVSIESSPK